MNSFLPLGTLCTLNGFRAVLSTVVFHLFAEDSFLKHQFKSIKQTCLLTGVSFFSETNSNKFLYQKILNFKF